MPIYEALANGIVEKDGDGRERVRIFCDKVREREIHEFIKDSHPDLLFMIDRVLFRYGAVEQKRLLG